MEVPKSVYSFEQVPSSDDGGVGWTIVRAPSEGKLPIIIVSPVHLGLHTHYYRGSTTPHRTDSCPACLAKHLPRWHGYLLAVRAHDGAQIIWEFPAACGFQVVEAHKEYGGLRGQMVIVSRAAPRANAKVTCQFKGLSPQAHKLPASEDIWPLLSKIFGLHKEAPTKFEEFSEENLAEVELVELGRLGHINGAKTKRKRIGDRRSVCNSEEERRSLE